MKELSVEQKAKAYDEALERAKGVIEQNPLMEYLKKGIEYIFPELKEGDKIRKSLLDYLYTLHNHFSHNGGLVTDWIAWLEKQGEQKSADKIEPKFHEGEWITNGDYTWKIVEVKPLDYILQSQNGNIVDDTISHVDKQFHSFTIEDAKDGDILNSARVKATIIFKGFNSDGKHINAYCALQQGILIKQEMLWDRDFEPATKKQYDTLMKTMADAGYTFDFEKKELKKIEPIIIRDFNSVFSREQVEEIDKRIEESQRLYNAKLRDAMRKVEDFPMTD